MGKEAYYFSHDSNARHDDKILELRAEYGWEGYGLYWAIVETLRDCSSYSYPSNAKAGLALSLNIEKTKLEQFLNRAISLGLFVEENGSIYSESLMRRMEEIDEKRRKRAEAGRLGGKAKAKNKRRSSNATAKGSKESKVKERKEEELYIPEGFEERWSKFDKWFLKQKFEYVPKLEQQLTPVELQKLLEITNASVVEQKMLVIENAKDKYTKHKSVYLTLLNWINRDNNG